MGRKGYQENPYLFTSPKSPPGHCPNDAKIHEYKFVLKTGHTKNKCIAC